MLGAQSDALAPARLNQGAAAASDVDWSTRPAFMSRQVSSQCVDGVLRVSAPRSPSLQEQGGLLDRLKEPGFNLFYADEEADADARVAALLRMPDYTLPARPVAGAPAAASAPLHAAR